MTTYARNVNNQAVDVTTTDPTTIFHADVAAQFIVVPDGIETGATYAGGVWTNPVPVVPPAPVVVLPNLTPMQFYLALTPAERMAIKRSTDPVVVEFWATYQLAVQLNDFINPNLTSVQGGLEYLSVTNQLPAVTPAATYILPARIPQILAGIAQSNLSSINMHLRVLLWWGLLCR